VNIDGVAAQVRSLCPIFNSNVAGAAAYANGVQDQSWLPLPSAYVIPLGGDADPNESQNGLDQLVHERIGVIVVLETLKIGGQVDTADRRGQAAANYLDAVQSAIFKAILNWRPDTNYAAVNFDTNREARGFYLVGSGFPQEGAFDRARFFWQFVFGLDTFISDADGWVLPSVPLTRVEGDIRDAATDAEYSDQIVVLPPVNPPSC